MELGPGCSFSGRGRDRCSPPADSAEWTAELCLRRAGACWSAGVRLRPPPSAGRGRAAVQEEEAPQEQDGAGPARAAKPGSRVSAARRAGPPRAPRPRGQRFGSRSAGTRPCEFGGGWGAGVCLDG